MCCRSMMINKLALAIAAILLNLLVDHANAVERNRMIDWSISSVSNISVSLNSRPYIYEFDKYEALIQEVTLKNIGPRKVRIPLWTKGCLPFLIVSPPPLSSEFFTDMGEALNFPFIPATYADTKQFLSIEKGQSKSVHLYLFYLQGNIKGKIRTKVRDSKYKDLFQIEGYIDTRSIERQRCGRNL